MSPADGGPGGAGRPDGGPGAAGRPDGGPGAAGRPDGGRGRAGRPDRGGRGAGSGQRQQQPGRGADQGRPPARRPRVDAPRLAAFEVLRQVAGSDAYANLVLPKLLREREITGRDAGFATELAYGTLRLQGRYDAVLSQCTNGRPLSALDPEVLDLLRLGAHQILGMRVPAHAAVSETVALTRAVVGPAPAGLVNAVLRAVARTDLAGWLERIGDLADPDGTDPVARLAVTASHPEWITRALRQSLLANGHTADELDALLDADNESPRVTLVARPGLVDTEHLAAEITHGSGQAPVPGRWSPFALVASGGDPARLPSVRRARAGVQDEGSQLVALALAAAPLASPDGGQQRAGTAQGDAGQQHLTQTGDRAWLDLCAGPGGKAALLGALAHERGATLLANEVAPHRAGLVRGSVSAVPEGTVEVRVGDGRDLGEEMPGAFDRVLVDAPCTGLGALRRRPESRWRRSPGDLTQLGALQRSLLDSAIDAARVGGVVAYVTCSPHVAETRTVVEDVVRRRGDVELLDAAAVVRSVAVTEPPGLGDGPFVQLWPHVHGTDAMFLALLRRTA
ncbi:rRNA small subunit methyltransferase B [Georgenia sp. EYE_87]|uniref:RsmB/NOP family class I SAM-dependent RNA methyltransferase n=1 Tax=Georgenia sp. EYE_87 TaxID=2853448 RepID=UPI002002E98D|nr:transcription antitermination factor NusB [Georgenia sp. EYE_87]MCK6209195.1 rRNA small subunit methyltransferase B [Georgenia sp. EYE_87]